MRFLKGDIVEARPRECSGRPVVLVTGRSADVPLGVVIQRGGWFPVGERIVVFEDDDFLLYRVEKRRAKGRRK